MIRETVEVLKGSFCWNIIKLTEKIDDTKVVLVLTGEDTNVDNYALMYLDEVIKRKFASKAIIITFNKKVADKVISCKTISHPVKIKIMNERMIELIYKRYCLDKFNKNLFFTYIDKTQDNLLGRFMREMSVDARNVVCLALYNLRKVPEKAVATNV